MADDILGMEADLYTLKGLTEVLEHLAASPSVAAITGPLTETTARLAEQWGNC